MLRSNRPRVTNETPPDPARARRLVEHTPKILAGLAGMCGVAYLAGSIYTRAYFSEFGAAWILDEVPAAVYFSQSWVPLLLILFVGYLATTNLASIDSPDGLAASPRFKASVFVVHYGPWLCIGLFATIPLAGTFDYVTLAIVLSVVAIGCLLLMFSSALEILIVRFSTGDRHMDLSKTYFSCAVIAVGLYCVPAQLGLNWAKVDKHASSTLSTVYLGGDDVTAYKLLFSVGERLYVFPAKYEGEIPPIKTTSVIEVRLGQPDR